MSGVHLTEHSTGPELIRALVYTRHTARKTIQMQRRLRTLPDTEEKGDILLDMRFAQIQTGQFLFPLCTALDERADREAVFEALNVNRAHRDTEDVRKYGRRAIDLIFVLDLENSATTKDDIEFKPLKWCLTLAFTHMQRTNEKFDRAMHEVANETFNGAFGEYRERPLVDRLVGRSV